MKLVIHLHVLPRLRVTGAVPTCLCGVVLKSHNSVSLHLDLFLKFSPCFCSSHLLILLSPINLFTGPCPFFLLLYLTLVFSCGIHFCPDGGGISFLQNITKFLPDHMVSHLTKPYSLVLVLHFHLHCSATSVS